MASFVFIDTAGEEIGIAVGTLPRKGDYITLEDDGPRYRVHWVELLFAKGDIEFVAAVFQKVCLVQISEEVTYGEAEGDEGKCEADDTRGVQAAERARAWAAGGDDG